MRNDVDQFLEYCRKTSMSYSYKPVLIMALVEHSGVVSISEAVNYFVQYYGNRLTLGLVAERNNSIYSNLNCTLEQISSNIKTNPVKALLNSPFFIYDRSTEILSFIPEIRRELTANAAEKIISVCMQRLDEYYLRIKDQTDHEFICFHKPEEENGYLSNWYPSRFSFRGTDFSSVEQYMMFRKAIMFGDDAVRNRILSTNDVEELKQLGRSVRNYNDKLWGGQRQLIVYQGLLAKFAQNDELRIRLLNTGSAILAECAVTDKIWGIGLSMDDDRRFLIDQWQGSNMLGFSLMQVRNMLQETRNL